MKRFASVLALTGALAGVGAGTASADTNFAVQAASIDQKAGAYARAVQFGGSWSLNYNQSNASAANYASIGQWLVQVND